MYHLIITRKPEFVLDLGSGLTTLIAGYALRKNGSGRLEAWEHMEKYADRTRQLISRHRLENWVSVTHSPLEETLIEGKPYYWFRRRPSATQTIDFLIVDSPPGSVCRESRFPAVPILKPHLASEWTIILDDTDREDEKSIEHQWKALLGDLQIERRGDESKSCFSIFSSGHPGDLLEVS